MGNGGGSGGVDAAADVPVVDPVVVLVAVAVAVAAMAVVVATWARIMSANSRGEVMCGRCPPGRDFNNDSGASPDPGPGPGLCWLRVMSSRSCSDDAFVKWSSVPCTMSVGTSMVADRCRMSKCRTYRWS